VENYEQARVLAFLLFTTVFVAAFINQFTNRRR